MVTLNYYEIFFFDFTTAKELDDLVRTGTVEGASPLVDKLEIELSKVQKKKRKKTPKP